MISCDNQSDAERNAERHKQCIEHPHRARDVVLIRDITNSIREIDPGHQRNNRTDDDLVQMVPNPRLIQKTAISVTSAPPEIFVAIFDILPRSRYSR